MRLRILSDLHLEAASFEPPPAAADLVILAGDIQNGAAGVEWAARTFDGPILYLAGNHEFYDGEYQAVREALGRAVNGSRVTLLDCTAVVVGGVRFLGCTLWTDMLYAGPDARDRMLSDYRGWLVDYRAIRFAERAFAPDDALAIHAAHREWLEARLDEPFAGPTVVVTHHAPHPGSVAPAFASHPLNPAFVNDLTPAMGKAVLWIHGHTHTAFDYVVAGTRILCNPRGYPHEQTGFRPDLVVEI